MHIQRALSLVFHDVYIRPVGAQVIIAREHTMVQISW